MDHPHVFSFLYGNGTHVSRCTLTYVIKLHFSVVNSGFMFYIKIKYYCIEWSFEAYEKNHSTLERQVHSMKGVTNGENAESAPISSVPSGLGGFIPASFPLFFVLNFASLRQR